MQESTAKKLSEGQNFYLKLDSSVLKRTDLTMTAKVLYTYLTFRQNTNLDSWPKEVTMATDLGVSRGSIVRAKKQLIDAKLLLMQSFGGGKNGECHYTVKCVPERNPECVPKRYTYKEEENKQEKTKKAIASFSPDVLNLVENHLQRCEPARKLCDRKPNARQALCFKVRKMLSRYSVDQVRGFITKFSHKANRGDGWGMILKAPTMARIDANIANARECTQAAQEAHQGHKDIDRQYRREAAKEAAREAQEARREAIEQRNEQHRQRIINQYKKPTAGSKQTTEQAEAIKEKLRNQKDMMAKLKTFF